MTRFVDAEHEAWHSALKNGITADAPHAYRPTMDMNERRKGKDRHAEAGIGDLLKEIEKEDVPERLVKLAEELQAALKARRSEDGADQR